MIFKYAYKFGAVFGDSFYVRLYLCLKNIYCVFHWMFFGNYNFRFDLRFKGVSFSVYLDQFIDLCVLGEIFLDREYEFEYTKQASCIIDIGSNIGMSCIFFSILYPEAIIHAVEPNSFLKEKFICNTINFKNIVLHNFAISDASGYAQLYLNRNHLDTSIMCDSGDSSCIRVQTKTLQGFLLENRILNVDIVKFDIEGGEIFLIQDLIKLVNIKSFVGEIHPAILANYCNGSEINNIVYDGFSVQNKQIRNRKIIYATRDIK